MATAHRLAVVCSAVLVLCAAPLTTGRRLHQSSGMSTFTNEETNYAVGGAVNGTAAARTFLALAANEAELTIYNTPDLFLIGHGAADGAETAGTIGQVSAAAAAADASVAAAFANVAAITKDAGLIAQANQLTLEAAAALAAVTEVDNSTAPASQAATLALHGRASHDGSLVLYWANETAGEPNNGEVFNETVGFAAAIDEYSDQTLLAFVEQQLQAGGNPAVAAALLDVALHEMLGAIAAYRANDAETLTQQLEVSQAVRQATALVRSGTTVDAATIQPFLTQAEAAFAQGATAADYAAAGSPDPAAIDSLQSTIQALDEQLRAALFSLEGGAPALAPAAESAVAASSAGRR